eukprot:5504846-Pleurochrysis_carterae.AAC.1
MLAQRCSSRSLQSRTARGHRARLRRSCAALRAAVAVAPCRNTCHIAEEGQALKEWQPDVYNFTMCQPLTCTTASAQDGHRMLRMRRRHKHSGLLRCEAPATLRLLVHALHA